MNEKLEKEYHRIVSECFANSPEAYSLNPSFFDMVRDPARIMIFLPHSFGQRTHPKLYFRVKSQEQNENKFELAYLKKVFWEIIKGQDEDKRRLNYIRKCFFDTFNMYKFERRSDYHEIEYGTTPQIYTIRELEEFFGAIKKIDELWKNG